jgi:hypothetical protein
MGRPLKKRRGDKPPKSLNIKRAETLRAIHEGARAAGVGYTDFIDSKVRGPEILPLEEQAKRRARLEEILKPAWERVEKLKAEYAARGEPWPGDDHGDMYDEYGLPK